MAGKKSGSMKIQVLFEAKMLTSRQPNASHASGFTANFTQEAARPSLQGAEINQVPELHPLLDAWK
jgi:hypothetical protein